jgi:hypothetical protein
MIRLARGNGFKVHNFYSENFGAELQIWNRDIDRHAPQWLLTALAERTGVSYQRIVQTTLRDLESWAFETFNENGLTRWILPLGIFHRTRLSFGQQFCPLCFREDAQPYLRRSWRLALTVVCDRHGVLMQDRCTICEHPVSPHRSDFGPRRGVPEKTTMARCHKCRCNLGESATLADPQAIQMQTIINQILQSGYMELGGKGIYSPQFFDGLRRMMRTAQGDAATLLKGQIFERASIIQRALLLKFVMQLIEDWPARFLERCNEIPHAYTTLAEGDGEIPYWVHSVMRWDVYLGKASITTTEAMEMVRVAEQQGIPGSAVKRTRDLWGKDIGHLLPRKASVGDDTADMLIASLDKEISVTTKQRRNILLRDKVMFIAARCLKLKITQLARLKFEDVDGTGDDAFSFWNRIETTEQAYAMLRWYQLRVRPRLATKGGAALFVSNFGVPIAPNGIGMRFERAILAADLRRSIPGWYEWIGGHQPRIERYSAEMRPSLSGPKKD